MHHIIFWMDSGDSGTHICNNLVGDFAKNELVSVLCVGPQKSLPIRPAVIIIIQAD